MTDKIPTAQEYRDVAEFFQRVAGGDEDSLCGCSTAFKGTHQGESGCPLTVMATDSVRLLTLAAGLQEEQAEAVNCLMLMFGPVVSDAAIVGRSYGWREVLGIASAVVAKVATLERQLQEHIDAFEGFVRDCARTYNASHLSTDDILNLVARVPTLERQLAFMEGAYGSADAERKSLERQLAEAREMLTPIMNMPAVASQAGDGRTLAQSIDRLLDKTDADRVKAVRRAETAERQIAAIRTLCEASDPDEVIDEILGVLAGRLDAPPSEPTR